MLYQLSYGLIDLALATVTPQVTAGQAGSRPSGERLVAVDQIRVQASRGQWGLRFTNRQKPDFIVDPEPAGFWLDNLIRWTSRAKLSIVIRFILTAGPSLRGDNGIGPATGRTVVQCKKQFGIGRPLNSFRYPRFDFPVQLHRTRNRTSRPDSRLDNVLAA